MADYFWVQNNHGSNSYQVTQENNTYNLNPSETFEGYVNSEIRDTFLANLVGQPGIVLRQQWTGYGEERRLGEAAVAVNAAGINVSAATLESVSDVHLTGSGIAPSLAGLGGGYAGRVLRLWNVSSAAILLVNLAGSPTPSADRLFVPTVLSVTGLLVGARVEARYDGTAGYWRVG